MEGRVTRLSGVYEIWTGGEAVVMTYTRCFTATVVRALLLPSHVAAGRCIVWAEGLGLYNRILSFES